MSQASVSVIEHFVYLEKDSAPEKLAADPAAVYRAVVQEKLSKPNFIREYGAAETAENGTQKGSLDLTRIEVHLGVRQ